MAKDKQIKGLHLAGALVATAGLGFSGQTVHADTNAPAVEASQETAVTAEQVATAKADSDKANEALNKAKDSLDSAQGQKETATTALTEAEKALADTKAVDSSSEAQTTAEQALETATTTVEAKETEVAKAEQGLGDAQTAVEQQKNAVEAQKTAISEAEAQAKADAEAVKALEDGTVSVDDAKQAVDSASVEVAGAKAKVEDAKEVVVQAEASDQALATEIKGAEQAVSGAEAKVADAKEDVKDAQDAVKGAQDTVDVAKSDVARLSEGVISWDVSVNVPAHIAEALNGLITSPDVETFKKHADVITNMSNEEIDSIFNVIVNIDDKATVDLNNIPEDVRKQMNIFMVEVANKLREAAGLPKATASDLERQFAEEIAKRYQAEYGEATVTSNSAKPLYHNDAIRQEVYEQFGKIGDNIGHENIASPSYRGFINTQESNSYIVPLKDLFVNTYKSVKMFVFKDAAWGYGHAKTILAPETLGVATYGGLETRLQYSWTSGNVIVTGRNQNRMDVDDYTKRKHPDLYADTVAKNARLMTPIKVDDKQAELTAAKTRLSVAEVALKANQEKLVNAEKALETAEVELAQAEARHKDLLSRPSQLADAKAKAEVSAQAVEDARKAFDKADAELATKTDKVAQAKKVLENAQADLTKAKEAQALAQKALDAITNAKANLAQAQANYDKAKATADRSDQDLATAQANYDKAKNEADKAQATYEKLEGLYRLTPTWNIVKDAEGNYHAIPNKSLTEEAKPEITIETKVPSDFPTVDLPELSPEALKPSQQPVVNGTKVNGQATAPVSKFVSASQIQDATKPTYSRVARAQAEKTLPQTGDNAGVLATLAGFMTLGLGASLANKRRRS